MSTDTQAQPTATPGELLRAKWLLDGVSDLNEGAARLRAAADRLSGLAAAGWTLEGPVEDDYGVLIDPQGHTSCNECFQRPAKRREGKPAYCDHCIAFYGDELEE